MNLLVNRHILFHPRCARAILVAAAIEGPFKPDPIIHPDDRIVMVACTVATVVMLAFTVVGWLK